MLLVRELQIMRLFIRTVIILTSIVVILLTAERYLFSSERAYLFAWWFFSGDGQSTQTPISKRVDAHKVEDYKQEIGDMLKNATQDSTTQKVALSFTDEFADDPLIREQLIIVAFDHPTQLVRCKLRKQLALNHEIIITTYSEQYAESSRFSMADDCE